MLLLADRPVRRRNRAEVWLGTHLQVDAACTTGHLVFAQTKTGAPYEVVLPGRLLPWLELFAEHYRSLLTGSTVASR